MHQLFKGMRTNNGWFCGSICLHVTVKEFVVILQNMLHYAVEFKLSIISQYCDIGQYKNYILLPGVLTQNRREYL